MHIFKDIKSDLLYIMLCLQFRSQRSSALCVLREHCVTVSALTLLYIHMLTWQQGTQSWFLMEPVCVKWPCLCCNVLFWKASQKDIIDHVPISPCPYSLLALCVSSWLVTMEQEFWPHHTRHKNIHSWNNCDPLLVCILTAVVLCSAWNAFVRNNKISLRRIFNME